MCLLHKSMQHRLQKKVKYSSDPGKNTKTRPNIKTPVESANPFVVLGGKEMIIDNYLNTFEKLQSKALRKGKLIKFYVFIY